MKRVRQSADPLNQLITEAEDTKDSSLKDSLFTEAARTAMEKGKLKTAVDLIHKVEAYGERPDGIPRPISGTSC